jgi:probable dihydroxyacetone kinase regulator
MRSTTSERTKKMLAASLKRLLEKKPLHKITIRDIIEDAGVNRQTFYYHFHDIFDLLEWMYREEAFHLLGARDVCLTWEDDIALLLKYLRDNEKTSRNVLTSVGREQLEQLFANDIRDVMKRVVDSCSEGIDAPEDFREFLVTFYAMAVSGVVLDWFTHGMRQSTQDMVRFLECALEDNVTSSMRRAVPKPCM